MNSKMLSQSIAQTILSMITIEKRFTAGDKLPNENDLAAELNISRTTLREAIRILVAYHILEIQRGKYFIRNQKVILPFSVQVHHSFVDGVHIGKLANALQNYLDEISLST